MGDFRGENTTAVDSLPGQRATRRHQADQVNQAILTEAEEVKLRAEIREQDGDEAVRRLHASLAFFREHLVKRRAWLLEELDDSGSKPQSRPPR